MNKIILDSDSFDFDASAKTVTFLNGFAPEKLAHILVITNLTDNIIIYNFACEGYGGTYANPVLTLEYNTTSMSDTDTLQAVIYTQTTATDNFLKEIKSNTQCSQQIIELLITQNELLKQMF
jgi:hypothetical protein